jgi:predicted 2-oxoglutarate/Fe(II)-dependent dioxygenase YbiX
MNIINHNFGIVEFENVINIDQNFLFDYINYLKSINPYPFDFFEENGQTYAINKTGFKFNIEDIKSAPNRYNILFLQQDSAYKEFINKIDEKIYECLVEYCKIFPDAAKTIWWKNSGHIAGYSEGQFIGAHSDSHIEFDFKNAPQNQTPIHNTVSCGLYLNNSVDLDKLNDHSFVGGEMHFAQAGISYRPKAGGVIMYPSNYIGRHEVKPVTSGNRYVYLQFFSYGKNDSINENSIRWLKNLQKDSGII